MAFYSSSLDGYEYADTGEYYTTPNYTTSYDIVPFQNSPPSHYTTCYDIVPFQDSSYYSNYEYTQSDLFECDSTAYNGVSNPFLSSSHSYYSTHNFNEPKLLEYNSTLDNTHYFASDTVFVISYSTAPQIDDTEFEDYDRTPFDGGYDIVQTYGKPLPASDGICYPRSIPVSNGLSLDNFSYGSIPSPYGNDKIGELSENPLTISEPTKSGGEKQQPNGGNGDKGDEPKKPLDLSEREDREGYTFDYGGRSGDYGNFGYGYDKPVIQAPYDYGCGLEAMDLFENLFGYWPCLAKNNRREYNIELARERRQENQWESAADYLFGSPYKHGGDGSGN